MSNLFIGVKRIIAVDSSEFAYAELDLDAHCMLVAEGNVGKSSLINAIRLFFLPECSMAKQAINFGFSDSNGDTYKSETTFHHYFPSKFSFLILEYEKRVYDGASTCQILSATSSGRLKFERMFTQLSYHQLRHLFWEQGNDPDGIGRRVDNLSKQGVYDFIYKHDKHAQLAKEPAKTASIIYENELRATKFTLFPLAAQTPQSINSLRALIKLLFVASSKNKQPFTEAIANIIEGRKKSSQDQLGFSISEFKERHEGLQRQENHLTNIINEQVRFERLEKSKASFIECLSMLEQVKPALAWLKANSQKLRKELAQYADKNTLKSEKLKTAKNKLSQLEKSIELDKREVKNKNVELKKHQSIVNRHAELTVEYPSFSKQEITEILIDELKQNQEYLDALNGEIKRSDALASLDNRIAKMQSEQSQLKEAIEHHQFDLASQLDKSTLNWLHSVNTQLANANAGRELTEQEQKSLSHFKALFTEHATDFAFFDASIKVAPFTRVNKQAKVDALELEINALIKRRKQLSQEQDSPLHVEHSLKRLQQAISLAQSDIDVLQKVDYAQQRTADLLAEIDIVNEQITAMEHKQQGAIKALSDAQNQYTKSQGEYEECQLRINDNTRYSNELDKLAVFYAKWLSILDDDIEFTGYLNDASIDMIKNSALSLERLELELVSGLRVYVEKGIVEDKHSIMGDTPFWQEISACFDDVTSVYANIDTQRGLLGKQIEEHNQTIGTKKEVIVQNYRVIKAFEKDINQEFEGLTINNVSSVEFEVGINKQFETLVHEFEETNLYSSQMQSDEFYMRLVAFAERFFDSDDNFTLTMDKVIESFEPRVQLKNKSGKEDKKQSNSTSALIKIKLVQVLLKRMLAHDCKTSFPIVHDEIANIDIGQFNWWLSDLSDNGFNLVSAGTHSTSPELQAKIERRFVLDALTTHLPYHSERSRVHWQGGEEFSDLSLQTGNDQAALI